MGLLSKGLGVDTRQFRADLYRNYTSTNKYIYIYMIWNWGPTN